jgi:hypothetical protein
MEEKTYMWMMIIAFVAILVATGFAAMELNEMKTPIDSGIFKSNLYK